MKIPFSKDKLHRITEANVNYYASAFVHPRRKMSDHDFIYMLDGEWKIGQNSEEYELRKDTLLILAADNLHYGISPCLPGTKTMYFHVSVEAEDADSQSFLSENLFVNASKGIKKIFSEIVRSVLSGNERRASLYFELLLCELEGRAVSSSDSAVAVKIKHIIHENPERFFSNSELAQAVGVSLKTAETKFKVMFGKTIHSYSLDFKIREAVSYLEMFPEMSIKEIAYNLGFYDEYHFSNRFRKTMGISPAAYKKSTAGERAEDDGAAHSRTTGASS